jgi:hypothetical protein
MKPFPLITVVALSISIVACQKQQSEAERRAEVERQVQERVAAERQQQQAQDLAQREASVSAREQELNTQAQATATPQPTFDTNASTTVARETTTEREREPAGSYSMFYTRLEPYGDWIETDDYGYVYRPRQAENARWRPYTDGHWVYTDAGWTWVSEEPFGWATYHYGRWTRLRGIGWIWVPGNEWAPAWVSWRTGGQYVGWAPLPPEAEFDRGTGIHNWSDNYYDIGPDQYVFVPTADIGDERIERAVVPEQQNVTIINQTTNVTNISYNNTVIVNQGPNFEELRGRSRRPIQRLRLERESAVPAQGGHAVVRGEVVAIPAPVISVARQPERPRAVKQTVKQVEVDRGWSAVANRPEAEQARAKMKSEATPPSNGPARKFVKPATAAAQAPAAPSSTPNATAAVHAPVVATATARPTQTPVVRATSAPRAVQTPMASASERPIQTPVASPARSIAAESAPANTPPAGTRPRLRPLPANTPPGTQPGGSASAAMPQQSTSPLAPPNLRHGPPQPRVSPSVASSTPPPRAPEPSASASAEVSSTPTAGEERRGKSKRASSRREHPAAATASPSVTP